MINLIDKKKSDDASMQQKLINTPSYNRLNKYYHIGENAFCQQTNVDFSHNQKISLTIVSTLFCNIMTIEIQKLLQENFS